MQVDAKSNNSCSDQSEADFAPDETAVQMLSECASLKELVKSMRSFTGINEEEKDGNSSETDQESDLESVHSLKTIHTEDMETYLNDVIETAEEVREAKALMDMMLDSNGDLKPQFARLPTPESFVGQTPSEALLQAFQSYLTSRGILYDRHRTILAFKSLSRKPDDFLRLRELVTAPHIDPSEELRKILRDPVESFGNYVRIVRIGGADLLEFCTAMLDYGYSRHEGLAAYKEAALARPSATFYLTYAGESVNKTLYRMRGDIRTGTRLVEEGKSWRNRVSGRGSVIIQLVMYLASKSMKAGTKASKRIRDDLGRPWSFIPAAGKAGDVWMMDIQEQILVWAVGCLNVSCGGKRPFPAVDPARKARLSKLSDPSKHFLIAGSAKSLITDMLFSMAFDFVGLSLGKVRLDINDEELFFEFFPGGKSSAMMFWVDQRVNVPTIHAHSRNPLPDLKPSDKQAKAFMERIKRRKLCIILGLAACKAFLDVITPHAVNISQFEIVYSTVQPVFLKDGSWFLVFLTMDPGATAWSKNASILSAIAGEIGLAWEIGHKLVRMKL